MFEGFKREQLNYFSPFTITLDYNALKNLT